MKTSSIKTDFARLDGARLVTSIVNPDGTTIYRVVVKLLSLRGSINTRKIYSKHCVLPHVTHSKHCEAQTKAPSNSKARSET